VCVGAERVPDCLVSPDRLVCQQDCSKGYPDNVGRVGLATNQIVWVCGFVTEKHRNTHYSGKYRYGKFHGEIVNTRRGLQF